MVLLYCRSVSVWLMMFFFDKGGWPGLHGVWASVAWFEIAGGSRWKANAYLHLCSLSMSL